MLYEVALYGERLASALRLYIRLPLGITYISAYLSQGLRLLLVAIPYCFGTFVPSVYCPIHSLVPFCNLA